MADRRARSLSTGQLLGDTRSTLGVQLAGMRVLHAAWPEIAGPHLAEHAWPVAIERDTLWLGIRDEARMQEIDFAGPGILQRLRQRLPYLSCRRVRCRRVEEAAPPASAPPPSRAPRQAPPVDAAVLAGIRNPDLRARLAALADGTGEDGSA